MSLSVFDVQDLVRIGTHTGTNDNGDTRQPFKDVLGVATDPTTVTLRIMKPNGVLMEYGWPSPGDDGSLVRESVGRFYADILMTVSGLWYWQITGTGAVQTREEQEFYVRTSTVD